MQKDWKELIAITKEQFMSLAKDWNDLEYVIKKCDEEQKLTGMHPYCAVIFSDGTVEPRIPAFFKLVIDLTNESFTDFLEKTELGEK